MEHELPKATLEDVTETVNKDDLPHLNEMRAQVERTRLEKLYAEKLNEFQLMVGEHETLLENGRLEMQTMKK